MYNGCDIMVFDYSCLAVIDLINLFILFVIYQRIDDLFANLPQHVRGLYLLSRSFQTALELEW